MAPCRGASCTATCKLLRLYPYINLTQAGVVKNVCSEPMFNNKLYTKMKSIKSQNIVPKTIMVPKMKRSLNVWVCGLSVVVRTQPLIWNTFMPIMHSSGGGVYEAGVLSFYTSSPFNLSLSLSFSPFYSMSHSPIWQRQLRSLILTL